MNRSETIAKISAALVKAQSEMGNATKGASNPFFKSKYADLNSIREAVLPALNAHGISVLQPTTVLDGKAYVETVLLHESGEFLSGVYEIVYGKANDPQSFGAACSYARRYSLQSMVNIGAEDDDGESASGRGSSVNKAAAKPVTNTVAPAVAVTTSDSRSVEVKKGGFGVKKAEVTTGGSEEGWA